ncbi:hypothetical protein [Sulfurimonas sp.]|uniref:hypothetical protein n=1 Tax=Sulfurimonas sp. TaxID=2022749 RepID=UPI002AAFAD0F|nr:hypothetical protein [Sulfurimonas sp.]
MAEKSFDIPLHDIKPLLEVQEYSLYYFSALIFIAIIVLIVLSYVLYRWMKTRNAFNQRKENLKSINVLSLKDTKKSAYQITSLGLIFKDDSPKHKEIYENLVQRLEIYKYKQEVDEFDSKVLDYIELYKGMLNV